MGLYSCIIGFLNLVYGASSHSRYLVIDNMAVRAIGLIFIISGIGLLLRYSWARSILLLSYIASIVEIFVTYDYADAKSTYYLCFVMFFIIILW